MPRCRPNSQAGEMAHVNGCWLSKRNCGTASVDGRGVGWDGRAQWGSWYAQVTIQDKSWPQWINDCSQLHMHKAQPHWKLLRSCKPQTHLKHTRREGCGARTSQMFIFHWHWLLAGVILPIFGYFKFLPLLQNGFGPSIYIARGQINAWVLFAFLPLRGPWPESLSNNAESSYADSHDGCQQLGCIGFGGCYQQPELSAMLLRFGIHNTASRYLLSPREYSIDMVPHLQSQTSSWFEVQSQNSKGSSGVRESIWITAIVFLLPPHTHRNDHASSQPLNILSKPSFKKRPTCQIYQSKFGHGIQSVDLQLGRARTKVCK